MAFNYARDWLVRFAARFNDFKPSQRHENPTPQLPQTWFPTDVVKRIKTTTSNFDCPVCYESAAPNPVISIPCGHLLCWECLQKVINTSKGTVKCPTCRGTFSLITCWKIFCYVFCPDALNIDEMNALRMTMAVDGGVSAVGGHEEEEQVVVEEGDEVEEWGTESETETLYDYEDDSESEGGYDDSGDESDDGLENESYEG